MYFSHIFKGQYGDLIHFKVETCSLALCTLEWVAMIKS